MNTFSESNESQTIDELNLKLNKLEDKFKNIEDSFDILTTNLQKIIKQLESKLSIRFYEDTNEYIDRIKTEKIICDNDNEKNKEVEYIRKNESIIEHMSRTNKEAIDNIYGPRLK